MAKKFWNKRRKKSFNLSMLYIGGVLIFSLLIYGSRQISGYVQENLSAFQLKEIMLSGNQILSRAEVFSLFNLQNNESRLLRVDEDIIVKKLLQSPHIKTAVAVYSLPSTLRITIGERQPVAFIYGRGLNLIDNEGVLIPVPKKSICWNLPFITGVTDPLGALGEKTQVKQVMTAVRILDYLQFINSPLNQIISEISIDKNTIRLRLIKGGALVHLDTNYYQDNLFVLSQYFKHYLNWNRLTVIEYFDLRFKDQLVIKEKKG